VSELLFKVPARMRSAIAGMSWPVLMVMLKFVHTSMSQYSSLIQVLNYSYELESITALTSLIDTVTRTSAARL
jgi:hypothetical protein